ncbi:MAG: sulfatase [Actinomycetota bacterium]
MHRGRRFERRRALRVLVAVTLGLAALASPPLVRGEPAARAQVPLPLGPNVLIIMTDDQRPADTLKVMDATQRIFRDQGTRYRKAVATTPVCCPSRASIFTRRYAHNHRVLTNDAGEAGKLDHQTTLQYYLRSAGYRTGFFGKYLNSWDIRNDPPFFDRFAIFPGGKERGYESGTWNVDGQLQTVDAYSTSYISSRTQEFLDESETTDLQPWLLFLWVYAPHSPYIPESRYQDAAVPPRVKNPAVFERNLSDKPRYVRKSPPPFRPMFEVYAPTLRTLMSVDDLVEDTFDKMTALGESETTLAFFVSDNGFLWNEHRVVGKYLPYVPSIRIPFLARWPGRIVPGTIDHRLVANIDIAPTVLEAAGIDPAHTVDGRSLITGPTRERILTEAWDEVGIPIPTWASTVTDRYHYIEYYTKGGKRFFREYYDLVKDPWELRNLFGDRNRSNDPDDARALARRLRRDRTCAGSGCP